MNRYKLEKYKPLDTISLDFTHLNDPSIKKKVVITTGDRISILHAPDKQHILEPVTTQEELDKMVFRGTVVMINKKEIKVPLYPRLGHEYKNHYNGEYRIDIRLSLIIDVSLEYNSNCIEVLLDEYLLDVNEIDHVYKLDDPIPVSAHELVIAKDPNPIKTQVVYDNPIIYETKKGDVKNERDDSKVPKD